MARLTATSSAAGIRSGLFWLVPLLLVLTMIPLRFTIAGQLLNLSRVLLILVTPYLLVQLLSGRYGRLVFADYAIAFFGFWMTLAVAQYSPDRVFGFAGSNVLQVIGGYLIGRAAIRSAEDFFALTKALVITTLILLPMAFYESVLNRDSPVLAWLAQYPSIGSYPDSDMCCRLGLNRAQTLMVHPIHYGIFSSLGIAIFFLGMRNRVAPVPRYIVTALLVAAVVFSVSSGALITMAMQLALAGYAILFYGLRIQWKLACWAALAGYVALELATTKIAFFRLAEMLAFSSHNAYTRQIMVNAGIQLVEQYPLFGYGLRAWPLPFWMHYSASIDNYWLVLAGSYGLPTFVAAFSAFLVPLFYAGGNRLRKGSDLYYIRLSWTFLMIALMLSLATVHLWDALTTIIYMMVGAGMFLMYASDDTPAPAETAPSRRPYTRFADRPPVTARPVTARPVTARPITARPPLKPAGY